jgi:hypothetical protein
MGLERSPNCIFVYILVGIQDKRTPHSSHNFHERSKYFYVQWWMRYPGLFFFFNCTNVRSLKNSTCTLPYCISSATLIFLCWADSINECETAVNFQGFDRCF